MNASTLPVRYIDLDETMKLLKAELRREFPGVKFATRRSRGTGYGYVTISWTDGPTAREVSAITSGYEGSKFDGMTDCESPVEHIAATGQGEPVRISYGTRGIHASRNISATLARECAATVAKFYGIVMPEVVEYEGYDGRAAWKLENDTRPLVAHFYAADLIHQCAGDPARFTAEGR